MHYNENWAIDTKRVHTFFDAQPDVQRTANGYRYKNCLITVTALPSNKQSIFSLPRTHLIIQGPEEEADAIHRRFFLNFLSAGG